MVEITAVAVKALREATGLPMMDCKKALVEAGGDQDQAKELLRKAGMKMEQKQAGRATEAGRIAVYAEIDPGVGAIVELKCETAPVANSREFIQLTNDLATQLAKGPGAETPEELLCQLSPSKSGMTLKEQYDDLYNRIRENFNFARIARIDGPCGGYAHHNGASGVILHVAGGNAELAKDICMHIAAMRPGAMSREDLDAALVERERQILADQAEQSGKPEKIIEKMVEGRMRNFYAEHCLIEQVFVKAEDGKTTVGKAAQQAGMKLIRFVHWELQKE